MKAEFIKGSCEQSGAGGEAGGAGVLGAVRSANWWTMSGRCRFLAFRVGADPGPWLQQQAACESSTVFLLFKYWKKEAQTYQSYRLPFV